jgi:thiol-disulfide isomerase/thioredoxin
MIKVNFGTMNERNKSLLKEWVIPILVIGVLWVTGWYKPLISFAQQAILSTGIIKPDTEIKADRQYETTDYQWDLIDLEGNRISFEEFKGKVVFLNLFATWCPPCIAEMPGIIDLYEDTSSESVAFIILSRDDSIEKVKQFMAKKEYTIPVYMSAGPVPTEFQSSVLPTTYILSKDGKIVSKQRGMADYNNERVRNFLRDLASK